jgi:repressor LexA
MTDLSDREREALEFIRTHVEEHFAPPSLAELARAVGSANASGVQRLVTRLIEKGYLRNRGGHRGLELVREKCGGFRLPFAGDVAAGKPIAREPEPGARFDFEQTFGGGGLIVYRVRGTSMVNALIADGDWIAVRTTPAAEPGETVVVSINGELTLKVLKKRSGVWWLHPKNDDMGPIRLKPTDDIAIVGVLAGVFRKTL